MGTYPADGLHAGSFEHLLNLINLVLQMTFAVCRKPRLRQRFGQPLQTINQTIMYLFLLHFFSFISW